MEALDRSHLAEDGREKRTPLLDDVASGQKIAVYAILLYIVGAGVREVAGPAALLVFLACLVMAWIGIYRIARGLGYAIWWRIVLMALMLLPLVGLLVLALLSSRATARLRKAGFSVGLVGARDY